MIQNLIKKVLRKWLKKKLYNNNYVLSINVEHFKWVYDSPLRQWRDRIWVITHSQNRTVEIYDKYLDYISK